MTTFAHHIRFSLAVSLQFQEDNRAESMTIFFADQVVELSNWLAAWLTALLAWLNRLPLELRRGDAWLDDYLAGWVADLRFMAEAVGLLWLGRQLAPIRGIL